MEKERSESEAQKIPSRVPIIALTAHAIKGYKEQCLERGMDDFATKPLKKKTLFEIVNKWL